MIIITIIEVFYFKLFLKKIGLNCRQNFNLQSALGQIICDENAVRLRVMSTYSVISYTKKKQIQRLAQVTLIDS